jgi:hypothetical protein
LSAATAFIVLATSSASLDRLFLPLLFPGLGIAVLALGLQDVDDEMEIIVAGDEDTEVIPDQRVVGIQRDAELDFCVGNKDVWNQQSLR